MGARATFYTDTKLIEIDVVAPSAGRSTISAQVDLYSDAKEDWNTTDSFLNFEFPFTTIGGDDLGGALEAGDYYFLRTDLGWRIRPHESDHTLTIVGNIYAIDPADDLIVPTSSAHTVATILERSQLTQTAIVSVVTGSGLNATQDARLRELHQIQGLESGTPMKTTASARTAGTISQTITGDAETSVTVTRV
jgi:hypothetical protein